MKHYQEKLEWLSHNRGVLYAHGCYARDGYFYKVDLHHMLRNTKGNRQNYKLFLNSLCNLVAAESNYHISKHGELPKIGYREAWKYEKFLSKPCHKRMREWANCPDHKLFEK